MFRRLHEKVSPEEKSPFVATPVFRKIIEVRRLYSPDEAFASPAFLEDHHDLSFYLVLQAR